MNGEKSLFSLADPTKYTVVRSDKKLSGAFDDYRSTRGAHAWVNNCQMNSSGGKVFIDREQIERGSPNVLCRNFVGDINEARAGVDREYRALHRAHEVI